MRLPLAMTLSAAVYRAESRVATPAGVGKITGPTALAMIAGAGNLTKREATAAAVVPAFLFFAVNMLVAAFAFVFLAVERARPHDAALLGPDAADLQEIASEIADKK
jgi:hypothetical protein